MTWVVRIVGLIRVIGQVGELVLGEVGELGYRCFDKFSEVGDGQGPAVRSDEGELKLVPFITVIRIARIGEVLPEADVVGVSPDRANILQFLGE